MAKVIIFGVGQIAEIAHFYLTHDSKHEVVAFTVDSEYIVQETFHCLPVIDFKIVEKIYPPDQYCLFIPISYKNQNKVRAEKYYQGKKKGYNFITYISSKAIYYNTSIGENCFILENNVIQPFTKIGHNCVLWSGNHIGHHTIIKDHCFLASHVVVSGSVFIGEYTFIGVNATIRDNITIGRFNVIGAGATVLSCTDDSMLLTGIKTKATPIKQEKIKISS